MATGTAPDAMPLKWRNLNVEIAMHPVNKLVANKTPGRFNGLGVIAYVAAMFATLFYAGLLAAAPLTIHIGDIKNAKGDMAVAVFASSAGFPFESDQAAWRGMVAIDPHKLSTTVQTDLPAGDYAVSTFHDHNSSGKFETNLFGMPTKSYGFSNNPEAARRAARFDEAVFTLPQEGARIDITLKH